MGRGEDLRMSDQPKPDTPEWRTLHGVRPMPQCPRCGACPPEIVMGMKGPECADCGSQSMNLFLWPPTSADGPMR
jgi:hypothetical protein